MQLGEIEIMPFEGGENIAQYVAFAASVKEMSSSTVAIESIGRALGEFTRQQSSVRVIATPLLGAGAGGIQSERVVAALKEGFSSTADAGASLVIHVLHREVFDRLRGNREVIRGKPSAQLRVFISHTSGTEEAVEWVKQLALFLIDQGVQARLDRFHLRRGMDLPQWMCNELSLADKVIIVCDETYKQKADGRLGGVGWETMVIQGDVANLPPDSTKYQVIVRAEDLSKGLPIYLKTKYAFHARPSDLSQSFRQELVRELLDMPLDERLESKEFAL
jgi:SEFIR domain